MRSILFAFMIVAIPASGAQIGGNWRLTGRIADVAIDRVCTIRQVDNKLDGPCKNAAGETVLTGEVNGNAITWKYEAKYDGATVILVFKGVMESDSDMKGTISASDKVGNNMVMGSFSAKRQ